MPVTRLIALNNNAGAFVTVTATLYGRRVTAREDEGTPTQGLQYTKADDGFVRQYACGAPGPADTQQIDIGHSVAFGAGKGSVLAIPSQGSGGTFNFVPATAYFKARSNTATVTNIRVIEYE